MPVVHLDEAHVPLASGEGAGLFDPHRLVLHPVDDEGGHPDVRPAPILTVDPRHLLDEAEVDVLAFMDFPKEHWTKICSTNPIERPNGEIKRRTNVVGIFPNDDSIIRLVGAILMEQNDEWAVQRARYMTLETIAPISDNPIVILSAVAG